MNLLAVFRAYLWGIETKHFADLPEAVQGLERTYEELKLSSRLNILIVSYFV